MSVPTVRVDQHQASSNRRFVSVVAPRAALAQFNRAFWRLGVRQAERGATAMTLKPCKEWDAILNVIGAETMPYGAAATLGPDRGWCYAQPDRPDNDPRLLGPWTLPPVLEVGRPSTVEDRQAECKVPRTMALVRWTPASVGGTILRLGQRSCWWAVNLTEFEVGSPISQWLVRELNPVEAAKSDALVQAHGLCDPPTDWLWESIIADRRPLFAVAIAVGRIYAGWWPCGLPSRSIWIISDRLANPVRIMHLEQRWETHQDWATIKRCVATTLKLPEDIIDSLLQAPDPVAQSLL